MLPLNDEPEEDENAMNEKQEKARRRDKGKKRVGLPIPIVVPGKELYKL